MKSLLVMTALFFGVFYNSLSKAEVNVFDGNARFFDTQNTKSRNPTRDVVIRITGPAAQKILGEMDTCREREFKGTQEKLCGRGRYPWMCVTQARDGRAHLRCFTSTQWSYMDVYEIPNNVSIDQWVNIVDPDLNP